MSCMGYIIFFILLMLPTMLSLSEIRDLIGGQIDSEYGPEELKTNKCYYIIYDTGEDVRETLAALMPYAPHWVIREGLVATHKQVYSSVIHELLKTHGGFSYVIHGQFVSSSNSACND